MQVALVEPARIADEWPFIAERLWPAVRQDPTYSLTGLYDRMIAGSALLFEARQGADGLWVVSLEEDNGLVAWTTAIAGKIEGTLPQRITAIQHAVAALELTLLAAGVRAHRLCGRDAWRRILPDYSPFAGVRNGLEKRLA